MNILERIFLNIQEFFCSFFIKLSHCMGILAYKFYRASVLWIHCSILQRETTFLSRLLL